MPDSPTPDATAEPHPLQARLKGGGEGRSAAPRPTPLTGPSSGGARAWSMACSSTSGSASEPAPSTPWWRWAATAARRALPVLRRRPAVPPREAPDNDTCERLTQMIGLFWDIGLDIGHSVRPSPECLEEARDDITVLTNLLEARLSPATPACSALFETARLRTRVDPGQFFKAKRAGAGPALHPPRRHALFNLEPNCKESPGGLRDLQLIGWISRAAGSGTHWRDLAWRHLMAPDRSHRTARAPSASCSTCGSACTT